MLTNDLDRLTTEQRAALTGPDSPFEMRIESVRGTSMRVFARRPRSLAQVLRSAAERFGDRTYLDFPHRRLTYREAVRQAALVAAVLRDSYGVGPGDRVALAGPSSPEYALTVWALTWLGAVGVGLNGWWTGAELKQGIGLAEPMLLIADERQLGRLAAEDMAGTTVATFREVFDLLSETTSPAEPAAVDEDDLAIILFTSGTTGRSKGAMIPHRALIGIGMDGMIRGATEVLVSGEKPSTEPTVLLLPSPFFHISGLSPLMVTAPLAGATLVFLPAGRWNSRAQLEYTQRARVSGWSGVPTQLIRLLRDPEFDTFDLSSLRSVGLGGAPISTEVMNLLAARLPGVRPGSGYGSTETAGIGTTIAGKRLIAHPQSIGLATATADVVLRDIDGTDVTEAPDAVGEICIRCSSTFLGYWRDAAATAAVLDEHGWYRTGDYGRVVDGMLQLESRLRDMIIRGGENIYPLEIENRLSEHPRLTDAAVIGIPHDELGQEVVAVVVVAAGATVEPAEIREWVGQTLAAFKVPAHIWYRDSLPYSPTGKVLKRELERESESVPVGDVQ